MISTRRADELLAGDVVLAQIEHAHDSLVRRHVERVDVGLHIVVVTYRDGQRARFEPFDRVRIQSNALKEARHARR